jgi:hypothetical protein
MCGYGKCVKDGQYMLSGSRKSFFLCRTHAKQRLSGFGLKSDETVHRLFPFRTEEETIKELKEEKEAQP